MQAVLIGYTPSGQGWVGWVVLAVIVAFLAVGLFGVARGWLIQKAIESAGVTPLGPPSVEEFAVHEIFRP